MKKLLTSLVLALCATFALAQDIVITCVFDGPLSGGLPKGVELYCIDEIDLSLLGIGGANNGGGSDSIEYQFPAGVAPAGSYLYVSSDSAGFADFFGFNADYVTEGTPNAMAINGDDAIELFYNGTVIDVFGDINTDGTGQPWEYLDGWAARKPMTGPDGSTFVLNNWNFSGVDALDGETTNATAANPVPFQTYTDTTGGGGPDATVILQNLAFTPRDLTIEIGQTVRFTNVEANTEHNVNGSLNDYPCNPFGFFSGAAEDGPWDFDVTFNLAGFYDYQCDPHTDFDMFGTITVVDPDEPIYFADAIGNVTDEDANGIALSLGQPVTLTGVVYGANLRPPGLLFNIIDQQGDGITIFKDAADCYEVFEGDEVSVAGTITQFNGLTQLTVAKAVTVNSIGNPLTDPVLVTVPLSEETEGKFIRIEDVMVDSIIQTGGSGWNIFGSNSNGNYVVRLDSDVFADAPYEGKVISVNGLGGQFDSSEPYTDGYQLLPRGPGDIEETLSAVQLPASAVEMFPNPAGDLVSVRSDLPMQEVRVFDLRGQLVTTIDGRRAELPLGAMLPGTYVAQVITEQGVWTGRLIKL